MACGPGKGLQKLNELKEGAVKAIDDLKDSAEGIMGSIDNLGSVLDEQVSKIAGGIKEMLPTIELPELPTIPDFKALLPKLPELSLQLEVGSILDKIKSSDPVQKAQAMLNLESLKDKFPNLDVDALKADILSGKIDADNLCKMVPNIEKIDGVFHVKGIPITAPEIDAEALKEFAISVDTSALTKKAEELKEAIEQTEVAKKLDIKVDKEKQTKEKEQVKSFSPHINISF